jgi:peptidoglycan/LPS O-acetylase OafA/YrhL
MKYRLLDPLRGLAALWVFLYHYHFSTALHENSSFLSKLFSAGHLGVPMFFVISGYCLAAAARNAVKTGESTITFLYRRTVRIYPPLWFSMLLVISLPYLIELLSSLKTGQYQAPSPSFAELDWMDWLRHATLLQTFSSDGKGFSKVNAVYWTLGIEIQFYLVISLGLLLRARFHWVQLLVTLIAGAFIIFIPHLPVMVFVLYWPEFAFGLLLYYSLEKGVTPEKLFGRYAAAVAVIASALLAFSFSIWGGLEIEQASVTGYFYCGAFFALLLWFAHALERPLGVLLTSGNAILRLGLRSTFLLGAMSYSIYLIHAKLLFLVEQVARQLLPGNSLWCDVAVLAGTCLCCYPFYRYCEKPFCRSKRNARPTPRPASPQLLVLPCSSLSGV